MTEHQKAELEFELYIRSKKTIEEFHSGICFRYMLKLKKKLGFDFLKCFFDQNKQENNAKPEIAIVRDPYFLIMTGNRLALTSNVKHSPD